MTYGVPSELSFGVRWIYPITTYDDFTYIYVKQLAYLSEGYIPYLNFAYNLPPFFLYALYPFYALGGANAASIPIIVSDAATAPVIYLITRHYASNSVAWAAGIAYALSPFALIYEGFFWFNSQPMTFFIVLAAYLHRTSRPVRSSISLAFAVLFKQLALFVLPLFAILWLWAHKRSGIGALILAVGIITMASLPFLLISYRAYLSMVSDSLINFGWVPTLQLLAAGATSSTSLTITSQLPTARLVCSPLSSNLIGITVLCTSGMSIYPQFVPFPSPFSMITQQLGLLLRIPLALLLIPALYAWKKRENALEITTAYFIIAGLILFAILVHSNFRYYWLPVYCLLLAASRNSPCLGTAIGFQIASLLTPENAFQDVLPLFAILGLFVAEEVTKVKVKRDVGHADPEGSEIRTSTLS